MKEKTLRLPYKIKKESGYWKDESGIPGDYYICIHLDTYSYSLEKKIYKKLVKNGVETISENYNIDKKWIVHVTLDEYLDALEKKEDLEKEN